MSFFGQLLAGAVGGAAGGYIKDREEDDRLAEKRMLLEEKQRDKLEVQQRDHALRLQLAELKGDKSSGGGNGASISKGDYNYLAAADEALRSNDPNAIERVVRMVDLGGGQQAAAHARYVLTGQAPDRQPTSDDVLASMATDGKEYTPEPPKGGTRGQREAAEGLQAFQRAYARGVTKVKDQADGEAQENTNDIFTNVFGQGLQGGKPVSEASRDAAMAAEPAEFDKTTRTLRQAGATEYKADKAAATAASQQHAIEVRTLNAEINKLMKTPSGERKEDRAARLARVDELRTELSLLKQSQPASQPASKPSSYSVESTSKPAPKGTSVRDLAMSKGYKW